MIGYRPRLSRQLSSAAGVCAFIMLNPSTADDDTDDPTVRRCKSFAQRFGCGKLMVVNLFTARATKPLDLVRLWRCENYLFREWEPAMREVREQANLIIAAWGAEFGPTWFRRLRAEQIQCTHDICRGALSVLGWTSKGDPRHPLYLRADAELQPYMATVNAVCTDPYI